MHYDGANVNVKKLRKVGVKSPEAGRLCHLKFKKNIDLLISNIMGQNTQYNTCVKVTTVDGDVMSHGAICESFCRIDTGRDTRESILVSSRSINHGFFSLFAIFQHFQF